MPAVNANVAEAASTPPATPQKKFSTVSAMITKGTASGSATKKTDLPPVPASRSSVKGLFEPAKAMTTDDSMLPSQPVNDHSHFNTSSNKRHLFSPEAAAAVAREDGPWSVSVAEVQPTTPSEKRDLLRKKSKANGPPLYTLYITTPTHNLTLIRSSVDLVELDTRLRDAHATTPTTLPTLPPLPQGPLQAGRKLLQTISRTLSPSGHRHRGLGTQPLTDTTRQATVASPVSQSPQPEVSSNASTSAPSTTSRLATYLTTVSNMPSVKKHKAWTRFIRVTADDLQSVRVERRVRKTRSDLAQHVKTAVAPANVNVAATPSQSDIGEEGGRTDDDRSFSGRSTSHSFRQDRQEASNGTRSSDGERSTRAEDVRKSQSFAGIPEESERSAAGEGQGDSETKAGSSSRTPLTSPQKRERRHRKQAEEKVTVDDFDMIRVLGKGCAGKVLLVRHKPTKGLFAMKSIHKRHVLAHQELQHTLTEQAVLKRMAREVMDPFVVKLHWSFHDTTNLYLVMDFHPGGDLATQLSRWGRLGRDRARFYAAELVEGVEGLHQAGVIYRDLKPENVLIGVDGHIVLSDFGLSKEFPRRDGLGGSSTPPPGRAGKEGGRPHWMSASDDATASKGSNGSATRSRWMDERDVTTTFCGTAEYLAPEVIQGSAYSYEVDWWSFGTMLYEMLTGITPFWADTHADMYVRVLHDDLVFPEDRVLDQDTKSILRGLLQRNPMLRMKEPRIKKHPYFSMIEWDHVFHKRYIPPYIPPINPSDETDTQNFDETFLDMKPVIDAGDDEDAEEGETGGEDADKDDDEAKEAKRQAKEQEIDAMLAARRAASDGKSLFDGYSFRGRKDSGSIRSSIFSTSASDENVRGAQTVVTPAALTEVSAVHVHAQEMESSEDDQAAARAAAAVLENLEREAAASEVRMTQAKSDAAPTQENALPSSPSIDKALPQEPLSIASPAEKVPDTIVEAEREEEDADWDLVEAPSAGEQVMSEVNGGKGQNLFARGVVDTYRLLRRQESSRVPLNPNLGGRSTFHRLSRRSRHSGRDASASNGVSGVVGHQAKARNSQAGLTGVNGSAISLGTASGTGPQTPGSLANGSNASLGHSNQATAAAAAATPKAASSDEANRSSTIAGSPSLANSDDLNTPDKAQRNKVKKMKRFTNFFESIAP